MTELLVGTKKGLFRLEGEARRVRVTARAFAGRSVECAIGAAAAASPRSLVVLRTEDLGHRRPRVGAGGGRGAARGRRRDARAALGDRPRRGGRRSLRGRRPRPLFRSKDGGRVWLDSARGLWEHLP